LAGFRPFGECLGEEGEHFFYTLALEEAVGGEIACHGDWRGVGGGGCAEDGYADDFHCYYYYCSLLSVKKKGGGCVVVMQRLCGVFSEQRRRGV